MGEHYVVLEIAYDLTISTDCITALLKTDFSTFEIFAPKYIDIKINPHPPLNTVNFRPSRITYLTEQSTAKL